MERTVRVDLGERSYSIRIAPGLLESVGEAVGELKNVSSAVVITDSTVSQLYGQQVVNSLSGAGLNASVIDFPAGECNKTAKTYCDLMDSLFAVEPAIDRDSVIVALGGGVPGDVAGFVAATALRGLRFIQCPTTLLACVDSSVGGKTGIDHATGKNLIGAFHQPCEVIVDVETLRTLPREELCNGLAECVKHGVIRDAGLLDFIESNADAIFACDADVMAELIARNVAIKADVVARDERESGLRAHLNFGHTIGHAIEALTGFGEVTHGQGVALGMMAENHIAVARGLLEPADAERIESLLKRLSLPVRLDGLDAGKIQAIMQHDKKTRAGQIRMVLPTKIAAVDIFNDITSEEIQNAVNSY